MNELVPAPLPSDLATALETGFRLWKEGAVGAARATLEYTLREATARGSTAGRLSALQLLGHLAFEDGDLAASRALYERGLAECRQVRFGIGVASSLHNLGLLAACAGDGVAARAQIAEAANIYQQMGCHEAATCARQSLRLLVTGELPKG